MEEIKPLSSFKMNRKIPIKTKIEAIEQAKTNNNVLAAKKYGVITYVYINKFIKKIYF